MTAPVVAVTDGDMVYVSTGAQFPVAPCHLTPEVLCVACIRRGIQQLWWLAPAERIDWNSSGAWDMRPAAPGRKPGEDWIHAFRRGSNEEVDLVFPLMQTGNPWGKATRARELLNGLMLYRQHVGLSWRHSGGAMGAALLKQLHSGHRAIPLQLPGELPPPARDTRLEGGAAWLRALTTAENRMGYLQSYDKNGAYLGAMADIRVGAGQAEHITDPNTITDEMLRLPGYWLVEVADGATIPALAPVGKHDELGQWVTTPTVRMLCDRGETFRIHDAWIWRAYHAPLTPWQHVLRDARAALLANDTLGARVALAAVKATYSAFSGGYLASTGERQGWNRSQDVLYRPDIRHAVMAAARVNLIRRAGKCIMLDGITPLAIGNVDTIYFVSDEADPVKAAPASLTLGTSLKDFKPKQTVVLDAVRHILTSHDTPYKRLDALQTRLQSMRAGGAA